MKRWTSIFLAAALTVGAAAPVVLRGYAADGITQMEYLNRGAVAVNTGNGVYLSWRLLGTDNYDTAFDVYRGNEKIATVTDSTNYTDTVIGKSYTVVESGEPVSSGDTVTVNDEQYIEIPLDVPEGGKSIDETVYTYSPNDVTPADVDGDGEYELILKWEPSNSFDSGKDAHYNGNVYIDCYEMSGEKLWRIDMGININAGAHFTQIAAYDFDLDGKAELAMKTAPGTKDGTNQYVSAASLIDDIKNTDNTADYRHSEYGTDDTGGRVMSGPEFYTVFRGDTGAALDTVYYPHPRTDGYWGDNWGNRSERFLTAAAYLDGSTPSIITWRGYYAKTTAAAYNLVNKRLVQIADFDTDDGDNYLYAGNGNHNLTVGDVDGDGKDEIICGSLALDDDLTVLWCSGRGHGDALHLADYDPTHEGLEYFSVHEEYVKSGETDAQHTIYGSTNGNDGKIKNGGMTLYDAATGAELFHVDSYRDTGRGMMANAGYSDGYFELWGSGNYTSYGADSVEYGSFTPSSTNFRVFWNGDLYDELLDGASTRNGNIIITSGNNRIMTMENTAANNDTKNNPCLQADLFGDWREEVVARSADNSSLLVYTTIIPTQHRLYTLMHDRAYRMQVVCQNAGYNQPPHIGYYADDDNSDADMREYAAYIKTVHDGETKSRTKNIPQGVPTPEPTPEVTIEPTPEPTPEVTIEPTPEPTPEVTVEPTMEPTPEVTIEPTLEPTLEPTPEVTAEPVLKPTPEVTLEPTLEPTPEVTVEPTLEPTPEVTLEPTPEVTAEPVLKPTPEVTLEPTMKPTPEVTISPTPEASPQATPATPEPTTEVSPEPTPGQTMPQETKLPYEITGCTLNGDTAAVTVNTNSRVENAAVIFACYDNEGRLVSVRMLPAEEGEFVFGYTGDGFRVYVWDMSRLSPAAEVYVGE